MLNEINKFDWNAAVYNICKLIAFLEFSSLIAYTITMENKYNNELKMKELELNSKQHAP